MRADVAVSSIFCGAFFKPSNDIHAHPMTALRIGHYFKTSWSDALNAILNRPILSLGIFAAMFAAALMQAEISEALVAARLSGSKTGLTGSAGLWAALVPFLKLLAICMVLSRVMRFTLIGDEAAARVSLPYAIWRNWVWTWCLTGMWVGGSLVFGLIVYLIVRLTPFAAYGFYSAVFSTLIVSCLFGIFAAVRVAFIACSRATGETLSLSDAWALTRGRFWVTFGLPIIIVSPLLLVRATHFVADRVFVHLLTHANFLLEDAAFDAVVTILSLAAGSACLALLYRDFSTDRDFQAIPAEPTSY